MNLPRRLRAIAYVVAILAAASLASTACARDRWCEKDTTDTLVADSFCESGTPGYEWEPDGDDNTKIKVTKKRP